MTVGALLCSAGLSGQPLNAQDVGVDTAVIAAPSPSHAWSRHAARTLLAAIDRSAAEGLRPSDYSPDLLRAAIEQGEGSGLDAVAQSSGMALAHDYLLGRVTDRSALDWHIERPVGDTLGLPARLAAALAGGRVGAFLDGLLPTDARYVALRDALANAPDGPARDRIRANMERSRWMPRDLGRDYLYVNVPSYRLAVVEEGTVASTYTVVVGAPGTPTPQMATDAPSLVVNPWWNVPTSIVRSSNIRPGRAGFVFASAGGTTQVRQPPGPRNALGRLKINLMNDQAIYLHDTPAKFAFAKTERALSHGCVRVKNIDRLAAELMRADGGDDGALADALATSRTATLRLPRSWPVYLVYFTLDRDASGRLVSYGDPYDRDAAVLARLDGLASTGGQMVVASN